MVASKRFSGGIWDFEAVLGMLNAACHTTLVNSLLVGTVNEREQDESTV
jgi:hypothetical protein